MGGERWLLRLVQGMERIILTRELFLWRRPGMASADSDFRASDIHWLGGMIRKYHDVARENKSIVCRILSLLAFD